MLPMELWRADFDERYPIYQQIVSRFSRSLVREEVKPGDRIPSIRDMALALRVNTNTIQRAYQELERNKLIFSQRGTGYYAVNDEKMIEGVKLDMVRESATRFLQEMRELGLNNAQILAELKTQIEKEEHGDAAAIGKQS